MSTMSTKQSRLVIENFIRLYLYRNTYLGRAGTITNYELVLAYVGSCEFVVWSLRNICCSGNGAFIFHLSLVGYIITISSACIQFHCFSEYAEACLPTT